MKYNTVEDLKIAINSVSDDKRDFVIFSLVIFVDMYENFSCLGTDDDVSMYNLCKEYLRCYHGIKKDN